MEILYIVVASTLFIVTCCGAFFRYAEERDTAGRYGLYGNGKPVRTFTPAQVGAAVFAVGTLASLLWPVLMILAVPGFFVYGLIQLPKLIGLLRK